MNTFDERDTIVAQATPPGIGGVGVVRISGSLVPKWIPVVCKGKRLPPRQAVCTGFYSPDGQLLDQGIALYFSAPASFTGEPVLELQGHGGVGVMASLIEMFIALGARMAEPGEFSQRAFLNGKIDLTQAEAIADLIHAQSQQAVQGALNSLQGAFSKKIHEISDAILKLRVLVEANIDFAEEDVDAFNEATLLKNCGKIKDLLVALIQNATQSMLLNQGIKVAIIGSPNAGKSSLLNQLAGEEVAIVTEFAGTTRDIIREQILLEGIPLHFLDTAGLRETDCQIETIGIERAVAAAQQADLVIWVHDESQGAFDTAALLQAKKLLNADFISDKFLIVLNKQDITELPVGACLKSSGFQSVRVSAKLKAGIDCLKQTILMMAGVKTNEESGFIARKRHLVLLEEALVCIESAYEHLEKQAMPELMAEELTRAHKALCKITGEFDVEDLLGEIFSTFCIGK
jgi:tRNA modification GTPase